MAAGASASGAAGFAACGPARSDQTSTASATPVTIGFTTDWDSGARIETMKQALAMFAQRYPKITVNKTDLAGGKAQTYFATTLAAGTQDDVILLGAPEVPHYRDQGVFVDLAPYLKTAKIDTKIYTYLDPAHSVGSKRYFIPFQQGGSVWTVNKTMFQKENVPLPNENWTWNDWADAARKLTKPEKDQYGLGKALDTDLKAKFLPLIVSNGGHHISADFKKTQMLEAGTLDAIRWAADRMQRDRSWITPDVKNLDFNNGNVAMYMGSGVGDIHERVAGKFEWDIMPQPKSPRTGKSLRTFNNQPHGVTNKPTGGAARVEAAVTFALFMSGKDVQILVGKDKGSMPALRELVTSPPFSNPPPASMSLMAKGLDEPVDLRLFDGYADWEKAYTTALLDVWNGKVSADAGAKLANDAGDAVLAQLAKK